MAKLRPRPQSVANLEEQFRRQLNFIFGGVRRRRRNSRSLGCEVADRFIRSLLSK